MIKLIASILFATAILGLVACSDNGRPSRSTQEESLFNVTWILDSFGEQDDLQSVLEGTQITVIFDGNGGVVHGYAGCNDYGGEYHIKNNTLTIPDLMVTESECSEPKGIMEQEKQFLRILLDAENYEISDRKLRIMVDTRVLTFVSSGYTAETRRRYVVHIDISPLSHFLLNSSNAFSSASSSLPIEYITSFSGTSGYSG